MADFNTILSKHEGLSAAWEDFQVTGAKTYTEDSDINGESVQRFQLFAGSQEEKEEKAHEGFVACVKAWASWFFDAVIKLITCKQSEIKARPACCWTKLNVTEVKFNISGGDQSLKINRLVECALKSIGVANPEEVAGEKGEAKSAKASPQKSPSKKGEEKKEEVKSPLDANMEAFGKAVKEANLGDLGEPTLARFTFRVIDGNKAGTLEFLAKGADFSDKDAKIFKFAVKA